MTTKDSQFAKGDILTVTIDALATGGKALTRLEGMVIFMDKGIPGQTVEIKITKKKKRFAEAVLTKVISDAPDQITPRCSHFGVCGGCQWQNMEYSKQLEWKKRFVSDSLNRIAGAQDIKINDPIPSPETFFYRNKMEFAFGDKRGDKTVGLRRYGTHNVVDLHECYMQSERTMEMVNLVRDFVNAIPALTSYDANARRGYLRFLVIRETKHTNQCMVQIITGKDTTNGDQQHRAIRKLGHILQEQMNVTTFIHSLRTHTTQVAYGEKTIAVLGQKSLTEVLNFENGMPSLSLTSHADGFFQVNTDATARLYGTAIELAELTGTEKVWDLYCGVGGIALAAARNAADVFGMEITPQAIESANENATINNIDNVRFVSGDVRGALDNEPSKPDVVFVDPPRSGMNPEVIELIMERSPKRIIYVSCDPATQARDIALLSSQYTVTTVQPVDLFPQTAHIENIVRLDLTD
ncbi:23S rRNA (uracil(1939)-C(5))-methyltransferase RlmD [Halodesulfovibrio marinisediminis]|uniref:23S rRNA (Uracil1939-C5)-methyltransferase n=1 Tax=Halodesulfovibrio marinisediminis DSM 17456 TaxID=1121457 RepID=A0A1N6G1G8_9BACT|nr:23S rRNA (uracil(1939)-C(5))-methyltransferase RlmD [Halodesulfovibrio marinisediminis]SIO01291.1 23S rRNA (uracil1939-C5)-methyltransferase [Halodesulfovibrio marinisediminis DSM 17456]